MDMESVLGMMEAKNKAQHQFEKLKYPLSCNWTPAEFQLLKIFIYNGDSQSAILLIYNLYNSIIWLIPIFNMIGEL